jgi:RNA polymerase sigma factor (sigma-70 family)
MEPTDSELLRAYAAAGDEAAFDRLVRRHAGWVFAAARRRLRDDHLADDATQAVLLLLAEKAPRLAAAERISISSWLFRLTHFACLRLRRTRERRDRAEARAGMSQQQHAADRSAHPAGELLMLLEDSIARLPAADREAVVRRFYEGADLASIGDALGVSADAARKRIARAVLTLRTILLRDGLDAIPDELITRLEPVSSSFDRRGPSLARAARERDRINTLAKGAMDMTEQAEAIDFPVMTAEFFVKDVEANVGFFEKLGFRRRWTETPDAMGRVPRASVVGGVARIWLRRAAEADGTRPAPGVVLYLWIDGGADGLAKHRADIAARGVAVSPFADDHSLRNFTVTMPDGYQIGFFAQYR